MASPGQQLSNDQEEVAYWTDETVSGDEEDDGDSDIDDETMDTDWKAISKDGVEEADDAVEVSGLDPINDYQDRLLFSWNSLSEAERTEHRRLGKSLDPEFWEAISKPGGAQALWEERLREAGARVSTAGTAGKPTDLSTILPTEQDELGYGRQRDEVEEEESAYIDRPASAETAPSRNVAPTQQ